MSGIQQQNEKGEWREEEHQLEQQGKEGCVEERRPKMDKV